MNQIHLVRVIQRNNNQVVKELEVIGQLKASKVADGIGINLNHNSYFVTMTPKD